MERLAFIVAKELGSTKEDTELIKSIRQNGVLFEDVEKTMKPTEEKQYTKVVSGIMR